MYITNRIFKNILLVWPMCNRLPGPCVLPMSMCRQTQQNFSRASQHTTYFNKSHLIILDGHTTASHYSSCQQSLMTSVGNMTYSYTDQSDKCNYHTLLIYLSHSVTILCIAHKIHTSL